MGDVMEKNQVLTAKLPSQVYTQWYGELGIWRSVMDVLFFNFEMSLFGHMANTKQYFPIFIVWVGF